MSVWINIHAGVIVKMDIRPPTELWTDPDQPPSDFVPLHRPSDCIFLCWKQACSGDTGIDNCIKGLQWVIDFSPRDDSTTEVIQWYRKTYAPNSTLGDWPGQQGKIQQDTQTARYTDSFLRRACRERR